MAKLTPDFSIKVSEVRGVCPAGEIYAKRNIAEKKTPVLACEGPCIRGEIARLVANIVSEEAPFARCCYAETFLVPHSTMTSWVKGAEEVIVIDGCFLRCIGRIMDNMIDKGKMTNIDVLPMYKQYSDTFLYTDVPEETRNKLAREVAEKVLGQLRERRMAAV
jgi:uncharacterized metal-binding protein